jgi:hypothetical protein
MESVGSSKTLIPVYHITYYHITHCCENLESLLFVYLLGALIQIILFCVTWLFWILIYLCLVSFYPIYYYFLTYFVLCI